MTKQMRNIYGFNFNDITGFEEFAISKHHKGGECPNTCFADKGHRVGTIPIYSLLDGGLPGDVCADYCLECGKSINFGRKL